jgi:hypothetical protein
MTKENLEAIYRAVKRFAKGLIAVAIAGFISVYGQSEWYLAIAPVLLAAEKLITSGDWQAAGIRFARAAVATIIAGLGIKYGSSDWYAMLSPILLALDKYVRDTK